MRLWRISNYADLSGFGGLRFSGRWHSRGRPVVYVAEHPAGALLEMLVHMDLAGLPDTYQLITIEAGDNLVIETLDLAALPADWLARTEATRAHGDRWLTSRRGALLRVPSAIVPGAWNIIVNPAHPEAGQLRIVQADRVPLDRRLARR